MARDPSAEMLRRSIEKFTGPLPNPVTATEMQKRLEMIVHRPAMVVGGGQNRLYVGNLSFKTTPETLEAAFARVGEVREVSMPTDRVTGQPRGFAFVTMGNATQALEAITTLEGTLLDGRPLQVAEARKAGGDGRGFGNRRGGRGEPRDRY